LSLLLLFFFFLFHPLLPLHGTPFGRCQRVFVVAVAVFLLAFLSSIFLSMAPPLETTSFTAGERLECLTT
jgi:hypothetical protein